MEYQEAKDKFIQAWGTLGSNWGISRTMAQIHALLLISPFSLSAEEIMEQLQISRGNTNMNLRALMDWGLVQKELRTGERKEFFAAEKDIWKTFKQIVKIRKARELDPMIQIIGELSKVTGNSKDPNFKVFKDVMQDVQALTVKADKTLNALTKLDENKFLNAFMNLFK